MAKNDKPIEQGYTKEQIVASKQFAEHKDIVNALLESGKTYTIGEVQAIVNQFLIKEVK